MPGNVRPSDRQLVAADRADRGMLDGRIRAVARLHHVCSALVIALLAHHRPDQGDRAHLIGELLEALGKLDAADRGLDGLGAAGGRRFGMRVERLELARSAREPEKINDCAGSRVSLGLPGQELAERGQPAQPRQREEAAAVDGRSRQDHGARPAAWASMVP